MTPHYALLVRGRLDTVTEALFAEYDLTDVPVDIALYDLPMSPSAMALLVGRARALGIPVLAVERDGVRR